VLAEGPRSPGPNCDTCFPSNAGDPVEAHATLGTTLEMLNAPGMKIETVIKTRNR
jgi:hypothetical protein